MKYGMVPFGSELIIYYKFEQNRENQISVSSFRNDQKLALFYVLFLVLAVERFGSIVIKFEIVPFEVKLVISYKFERNRPSQISVVPKMANFMRTCRQVSSTQQTKNKRFRNNPPKNEILLRGIS